MAIAPAIIFILLVAFAYVKCESSNGYKFNNGNGAASFGELLKPPPLPLSHLQPVPFHGGASRSQRQNVDTGYHYQPPPPPPPPPALPTSDFKFPAPFYKKYNFNFVPPPQPFTTPASSMFQKVSSWLFPSHDTGSDSGSTFNNNNIAPLKQDCNPCNLVPWIPVIRYDLGAKNIKQSLIPTYGPPSPTAQNVVQFRPRPFYSQNQELPQVSGGVPHASYGPPVSSNTGFASSTYGPPSPTHTIAIPTSSTFIPSPSFPIQSSSFGFSSTSLGQVSSSYNSVSTSYGAPSSTYKQPSSLYGVPSSTYGAPSSTYELASSTYGSPSSSYEISSSTYGTPTSTTPAPSFYTPHPLSSTYLPATTSYQPEALNNELPQVNQAEIIKNSQPADGLELPKASPPQGFRNSYGEPIFNNYAGDAPYPVSATAAESTKIRTEVLPSDGTQNLQVNGSLALANPAPFTLNRGRNIHTLQPVALPNLSVNPLPPIFNARPFRPLSPLKFPPNHALGINHMQQNANNVNIEQSVPIAEYTHSVEYPTSFVQSPIIDVDVPKISNQSKAYRNIPNSFIVDSIRDISSQASEDHLSATKSNQDSSFESTGADVGNDLYEPGIPTDLKFSSGNALLNHKNDFADLRGIKDEDVDKYRTESNLQNIDSPLLYLKPGAPHKEYTNFIISTTVRTNLNDYELYDDIPTTTTAAPKQSLFTSAWDESRTDYSDAFAEPTAAQEDANKPKIVQIIIPYTTKQEKEQTNQFDQNPEEWISTPEDDYQARKVPTVTESYLNYDSGTESYTTISTTTEEPANTDKENYESGKLNTPAILNDLYDVKEPPFDIIKLQHNIDDWTEQEFSKRFKTQSQRSRTNGKYAKQIPDEYFTTNSPVTQYLTPSTYEFYDHEGSSSVRHSVTDDDSSKSYREYNNIDRTKKKKKDRESDDPEELQKLHIYTAASSFRSTSTTPAPWGKIETSISPLTKEKVYVVTSKPWMNTENVTNNWEHDVESFESKKTDKDNDVAFSDSLPFHSPRFSNRPSFATGGKIEAATSESSFGFSRNWHQRINELENLKQNNSTSLPEGSQHKSTNKEEDTHHITVTAEPLEDAVV